MTETKQRIWPHYPLGDGKTEYLRADVAEADKQLAVAAALREAASMCRVLKSFPQLQSIGSTISDDLAQDILALIPDAGAALNRALAAQRERDAKVAEAHVDGEDSYGPDFDAGWEAAAFAIAAAIRAQKP